MRNLSTFFTRMRNRGGALLLLLLFPLLGWGQTTLPVSYGGPWASGLPAGWSQSGLGTDYSSNLGSSSTLGSAKFSTQGASLVVNFSGTPNVLSFYLKGNPSSGTATSGTFTVSESTDNTTYTSVRSVVNQTTTAAQYTNILSSSTHYVKFAYTTLTSGNLALDDVQISAGGITTGTVGNTPVCANSASTISVNFTNTSTPTGGNYKVQLSGSDGTFPSDITSNLLTTTGTTSPLTATIPAGTTSSNLYKVRVVYDSPATTGTASAAFTISNLSVSMAPTTLALTVGSTNSTALTATENPSTGATRVWKYGTTSATGPFGTTISGQTSTTYTPQPSDFGNTAGTYYVVAISTLGGCTTTSNAATVTVSAAVGPVLTATPATLDLGTVAPNTAGVVQTYQLKGSNLTAGTTITAPAGVEISLNGFATVANSTSPLTITQAQATTGATISVRLAATNTLGALPAGSSITNSSTGATDKLVAVSGTVAGAASTCISQDFTTYTGTAPAGYSQSGTGTFGSYTTAGSSGPSGANSVQFGGSSGQTTILETPAVTSPQQLSFWFLGNGTNAASSFKVEGITGGVATLIENITVIPTTTGGTTKTYTTATGVSASFTSFRFTYTKGAGNVAFDDLRVSCGGAPNFMLSTNPISGSPFCVGQSAPANVSVSYSVGGGSFGTGNVFTAYLSDATGSFATTKTAIGTVTAVSSGTIAASIASSASLTTASKYRIRVEGSNPSTPVGTDNTSDLTVTSYLDNEATVATALAGDGTATLSFTAPANCVTNVIVTIKLGGTKSGKPTLASSNYIASPVYGVGTPLGGGFVVYNGLATGTITVTGLTNDTQYAFGVFTSGGSGFSNGSERTVRPVSPATLAEVLVPQYISGHAVGGTTHTTRLPYAYRATIGGLKPNYFYKFYNSAIDANTGSVVGATAGGSGSPIYVSTTSTFTRQTTPAMSTGSTFQAAADGTFTGWFGLDPTGSAIFEDQDLVKMRIVVNAGATTAAAAASDNIEQYFLTTTSTVQVRQLGTAATQATGIQGASFGTAKNLVLAYDNYDVNGPIGRPLAATWIETDGTDATSYAAFYVGNVDAKAGAHGFLTPNDNANGIRYIEQRGLADGLPVGCAATSATGIWPGTPANTTNPRGGITPLVLTTGDTPFAAPTVLETFTPSGIIGSTVTINGANFTTGPRPTVSFNGGPAVLANTGTSATSLTVTVPVGATTGPLTVTTGCGSATTMGSFIINPTLFYTKATGDVSVLATYGDQTDGSGTAPANFTAAKQQFIISGTDRTFSAATFTVSGTSSKVVLATNASLIIPPTGVLDATFDQSANSTLSIQNPATVAITSLNQGVQDATSTIELAQTGAFYSVPPDFAHRVSSPSNSYWLDYTNLKLTGGEKRIPATLTVKNDLTLSNTLVSGIKTNASTASASDYATIELFGSYNQLSGVTYNAVTRSIALQLMNTGVVQNVNGNGYTIELYRLATAANASAKGGRLTGAGSVLQLANSIDGGLDLQESAATLALDASTTLRFAPNGGGNFFVNTAGLLKPDPLANIELYRNTVNSYALGTLRLASGFTTINNFLLSSVATGGNTLILASDLTVNGTTTIQAGKLDLNDQALALNGPLMAGAGLLLGSSISSLSIGGTGTFGTLTFGPATVDRNLGSLTMNRAGDGVLTLGSPLQVNSLLSLTNGVVNTTATNLLTVASAATATTGSPTSYINGPLARATGTGARTTFFPIGKGVAYRPLTLTATAQTATSTYTAEQLEGNSSGGFTAPLKRVSSRRSFSVKSSNSTAGNFTGTITLSFGNDDYVNTPNSSDLVIAKRDAPADWFSIGHSAETGGSGSGAGGTSVSGTLTSTSFSNFSDFVLGALNLNDQPFPFYTAINPLPVELTSFSAQRRADKAVAVNWATASEKNSARFEVQRSLDGREFAIVATVAAQGTSTRATTYATLDQAAPATKLYYRLRQVDLDGSVAYSQVATVNSSESPANLTLYPNPATERISASLPAAAGRTYRVLNSLGQVLAAGPADQANPTVDVRRLPAGSYFLELRTSTGVQMRRFLKN